jgi:hypothetical protein
VKISYPCDLERQMLEYTGLAPVAAPAAQGRRAGR